MTGRFVFRALKALVRVTLSDSFRIRPRTEGLESINSAAGGQNSAPEPRVDSRLTTREQGAPAHPTATHTPQAATAASTHPPGTERHSLVAMPSDDQQRLVAVESAAAPTEKAEAKFDAGTLILCFGSLISGSILAGVLLVEQQPELQLTVADNSLMLLAGSTLVWLISIPMRAVRHCLS